MVILDRMLPDADGVELCREIRAARSETMIMMLTAKDALAEKLEGLGAGADDYMTKPFAFEELLARLEASFAGHLRVLSCPRKSWWAICASTRCARPRCAPGATWN
jgi:DNA-binding response OmpR family regulator